jgi:Protein of unknown function (DUF2793)
MQTPNLSLPLLAAGQAQKHVTLNDGLLVLDDLAQLAVVSDTLTAPAANPVEGQRFIVAKPPSGAWTDHGDQIAVWQGTGWTFREPRTGWCAYVASSGERRVFDGLVWTADFRAPRLGVGTAPDPANVVSVAGAATLLSGGSGNHQLKINKGATSATASLLFQTAFTGKAEIGLAGDDRLTFKVSDDGVTWREALGVDQATGQIATPLAPYAMSAPNLLINGDFAINQRAFAGGTLAAGAYGFDRWRAGAGGANIAVAGTLVTLTSGIIEQPVEAQAWGLANFAGQTVVVSVEDPSAALRVQLAGITAAIPAGSGRRWVKVDIPAGFTGTPLLSLSRQTGTGVSFKRVKLELGAVPSPWIARPLSIEEALAQRYFYRLVGPISLFLYAQGSGNYFFNSLPLPVRMRSLPSVSRAVAASGNIFQNDLANAAASALSASSLRLSVRANAAGECYANFSRVDCDAEMV